MKRNLFLLCFNALFLFCLAQMNERKMSIFDLKFIGGHIEYSQGGGGGFISCGANIMSSHYCESKATYLFNADVSLCAVNVKDVVHLGSSVKVGASHFSGLGPDANFAIEYLGNKDLRVGGEVGVSCIGLVKLNYGCFVPLFKVYNKNVSPHRITISVRLNFLPFGHFLNDVRC